MDTVKIEIMGTGCKKCQQLEANAKQAVVNLNLTAEVSHITDPVEIAMRGVMSTPAMAINGKVVIGLWTKLKRRMEEQANKGKIDIRQEKKKHA